MTVSLSNISNVNEKKPYSITVHSLGGVGKTYFGADACEGGKGVFILGEDGLSTLDRKDISRFPIIKTWPDFKETIKILITEKHDFKTVVIDTIDSLIPMLDSYVVKEFYGGKAEKADAYKQKYGDYAREMYGILKAYNLLLKKGVEVINLVHSVVVNHRDPMSEAWQRWEMNLPGGAKTSLASMLYDWSDVVLYATRDVAVVERKGVGNNRVCYTQWNAAYDAKCRHNLPEKITFSYKKLKELLAK